MIYFSPVSAAMRHWWTRNTNEGSGTYLPYTVGRTAGQWEVGKCASYSLGLLFTRLHPRQIGADIRGKSKELVEVGSLLRRVWAGGGTGFYRVKWELSNDEDETTKSLSQSIVQPDRASERLTSEDWRVIDHHQDEIKWPHVLSHATVQCGGGRNTTLNELKLFRI